MVDRIKQVMEYYEETPATFAEKLGVNRSNLTHLFSGRNQPSLEFAKKVLSAYPEVRTEWLIMGVGQMIKDPAEEVVSPKKNFIQTDLFEMDDNVDDDADQEEINTQQVESEPNLEIQEMHSDSAREKTAENTTQYVENKSIKPEITDSTTSLESKNQIIPTDTQEKTDSRQVVCNPIVDVMTETQKTNKETVPSHSETARSKKVEKIIFFYDDDTFKIFNA